MSHGLARHLNRHAGARWRRDRLVLRTPRHHNPCRCWARRHAGSLWNERPESGPACESRLLESHGVARFGHLRHESIEEFGRLTIKHLSGGSDAFIVTARIHKARHKARCASRDILAAGAPCNHVSNSRRRRQDDRLGLTDPWEGPPASCISRGMASVQDSRSRFIGDGQEWGRICRPSEVS